MTAEGSDLHGMVPDKHDTALLLIDVINHLEFEGNEGSRADPRDLSSEYERAVRFRVVEDSRTDGQTDRYTQSSGTQSWSARRLRQR